MAIKIERFIISAQGFNDTVDITNKIEAMVSSANIKEGLLNIKTENLNSAVIAFEGDISKFIEQFNRFVAIENDYKNNKIYNENEFTPILKSLILKNELTLSVSNKKINLKNKERVLLFDFNNSQNQIEVTMSLIY